MESTSSRSIATGALKELLRSLRLTAWLSMVRPAYNDVAIIARTLSRDVALQTERSTDVQYAAVATAVWLIGLTVTVAAFASVAVQNLRLPGLYFDEMIQVAPALKLLRPGVLSPVAGTVVPVFHHQLPIMTMDYIGSLKTFLFLPVVAVAGVSPESVRLTTITVGALSLVVMFAFCVRVVSRPVALLAVAILATDLSFIYYVRVDYGPTALMMLLKAIALWRLTVWWQNRRLIDLASGCLALGLGVYNKVDFLWVIFAIGGAAVLSAPKAVRARVTARVSSVGLASFAVGTAPLVYFNLKWGMPTVSALLGPATDGGPAGGFPDQLLGRVDDFRLLLEGYALGVCDTCSEGLARNELAVWLVAASALIVTVATLPRMRPGHWRFGLFALIATILVLVAASATRGGYGGHHVILTYPFPQLLAASGVYTAFGWMRPRLGPLPSLLVVGAISGATLTQSFATANAYVAALSQTGGTANFSDAIYELDAYLEREQTDAPVVDLDWGFYYPLFGLSQGNLHVVDPWNWYAAGSPTELAPFLNDPQVRYVAHAPGRANFPAGYQGFMTTVAATGLQVVRQEQFTTRDGEPIIDVYKVRRPASEAPQTWETP